MRHSASIGVLAVLLCAAAPCAAVSVSVRGEVVIEAPGQVPPAPNHFTVEMRHLQNRMESHQAFVQLDGGFQLGQVEPGPYELLVLGPAQEVIRRDIVQVGESMGPLTVRLKLSSVRGAGAETVSIHRLRHQPSRQLRKQFERARKETAAGRTGEAIAQLQAVVARDPEYLDAFNSLALLYYGGGDYAASAALLERALAVDPHDARLHANYAASLISLGRGAQAEPHARKAMLAQPGSRTGHYLTGLALALQGKLGTPTRELLAAAADQFPRARLALARVLESAGERDQARAELGRYLETARPERRAEVEQWRNSLR